MIHVVAGALTDAAGRVLIAQRPPGKHLAGGWEFPGGKLESGEARVAGLARELWEELGISIGAPRPLMRLRHAYDFGDVLIDMWVVTRYDREPRGMDGQALRWCGPDELASVELLPADAPIVRALRLPDQLRAADSPYYQVLEKPLFSEAADSGARRRLRGLWCSSTPEGLSIGQRAAPDFLVMRDELPADDLVVLCEALTIPVYVCGLELEAAWALGASGISTIGR